MALDGRRVKANASKHTAMRHGKLLGKEKQLDEELRKSIEDYFRKVAENDAEEERRFGKGNNPYHAIPGVKIAADRGEKIRKAIEALESGSGRRRRPPGESPGRSTRSASTTSPTPSRASCRTERTAGRSCRRTTARRWSTRSLRSS